MNKLKSIFEPRPVWSLSVDEFQAIIREAVGSDSDRPDPELHNSPKYIYGLGGIRKEFGVGHNTAQKLKDGILRDAVLQAGPGCKVIVDLELARKLYREYKERENLV